MKKEYSDVEGNLIFRNCHVMVVNSRFQGQEGVVVTFDEGMTPIGGPVIVYMRHAPNELFMIDGKCIVTPQARIGMPAKDDHLFNPLAIAFDGESDLLVLAIEAPEVLVGKKQPAINFIAAGISRSSKSKAPKPAPIVPTHKQLDLQARAQ